MDNKYYILSEQGVTNLVYHYKLPVELTSHEMGILELLIKHPKKVFTKQEIFEAVWQQEYFIEDKTIHVHISNIRAKLKKTGTDHYIQTVWGIGFKLGE